MSVAYILAAARSFAILGDVRDFLSVLWIMLFLVLQLEDDLEYFEDGEVRDQLAVNFRGGRAACILSIAAALFYAALMFVFTIRHISSCALHWIQCFYFILRKWFSEAAFTPVCRWVLL